MYHEALNVCFKSPDNQEGMNVARIIVSVMALLHCRTQIQRVFLLATIVMC